MIQTRTPRSGFHRTVTLRRKFRKSPTRAEQLFWAKVARSQFLGLKFRRQHGIGRYIVDFYCPARKLVIELDGDSHYRLGAQEYDQRRTAYFEKWGFRVARYTNKDVLENITGVFEDLERRLR